MIATVNRCPDSSEQLDVKVEGRTIGHVNTVTGEYLLTVCPTCQCRVAPSCGALGVCSQMECGADHSELLSQFFVEGVDEAP